jgi:hypothetical protein
MSKNYSIIYFVNIALKLAHQQYYSMIKINGISYRELNTEQKQSLLTKGQLKLMINEIDLQKQGYGVIPKYDKNNSRGI